MRDAKSTEGATLKGIRESDFGSDNLIKYKMKVLDLEWTKQVTLLKIECDCGRIFIWAIGIHLVECVRCGKKELWSIDGKQYDEYTDYNVMENDM